MSETVVIIARKLPGHEARPDLARLLKVLLRSFRLECIEVREDAGLNARNRAKREPQSEEPEVEVF